MKSSMFVVGIMSFAGAILYSITTAQETRSGGHPSRFLALLQVGDRVSLNRARPMESPVSPSSDAYRIRVASAQYVEAKAADREKKQAQIEILGKELQTLDEAIKNAKPQNVGLEDTNKRAELWARISRMRMGQSIERFGEVTAVGSDYIGVRFAESGEQFISLAYIAAITSVQE